MSAISIGIICIGLLFVLIVVGLPLGFGLMLAGFIGLGWSASWSNAMAALAHTPFDVATHPSFAAIPCFLLMSQVVFASGVGRDLFSFFSGSLGAMRGGRAMAAVFGSAVFAALSASSMAATAAMGMEALPEMNRRKYSPALATGSIAAGGALGGLIPPSSILIVLAILTGQSIVTLFAAGLLPGMLQAGCYAAAILLVCWWLPSLGPQAIRTSRRAFGSALSSSLSSSWETLLLTLVVIGGLLARWFSPVEAGAVGANGATLLAVVRKRLSAEAFGACIKETIRGTGTLYMILIGAMVFGRFVEATTVPASLSLLAGRLHPSGVLALMVVVCLILGMVLDAVAMLALTIPLLFSPVLAAGLDPVWAGIIWVKVLGISLILPPAGKSIFVLKSIAPDVPVHVVFRGVVPFLVADAVHLALLLLAPGIVMWLPGVIE